MKNKLTPQEEKRLIQLLAKVQLPTSYAVFKALCKSVPLIAVDIAVMPDKDHVLLTYRDDEFFKGWHIPGSIIRYKESVEQALKRVAKHELNIPITKPQFFNYFSYGGYREYGVALVFVAQPKTHMKVKNGKVFPLNKIPKELLKVQVSEFITLRNLT